MLGLIFALPIEMAALKTLLAGAGSKQVGAHCNVPPPEENGLLFFPGSLEGCPVVLTASGIGPERAEKATRKLLELFSIKTILSLGYAGALRPGAKTGELVIVRNVL
ncbi:MAG TPA: phosphorylase family protein, partial [Candidatus Hypogeohydataceae bacterium YC41]